MGTTKKERPAKRQLVRWTDDLDKQLLLALQYQCNEAGVRLPWDDIARLMGQVTGEDKFTGGAIVQHMSKLRTKMEKEKIAIPPPLRRGTITNVPSRIYATGNKRKAGPSTAKNPKLSTAKPNKAKARNVKSDWEDDDDSEDNLVEYDDNDDDDSDEEYGSAKKKRRVSGGKGKGKRRSLAVAEEEENEEGSTAGDETAIMDVDSGMEHGPNPKPGVQLMENLSPKPRTRGVRHNYSKMDIGSDDYGDEDDDVKAMVKAEEKQNIKDEIKSSGEVSPRTKLEPSITSAPGYVDLTHDLGNHNTGYGSGMGSTYNIGQPLFGHPYGQPYGQSYNHQTQQYQMPALTGLGFPASTSNSISTNRTGSVASLTSATTPSAGYVNPVSTNRTGSVASLTPTTAPPTGYVNPGSYAEMVNEDTTTNSIFDVDFMYGGQFDSATGFSSPFFPNDFVFP